MGSEMCIRDRREMFVKTTMIPRWRRFIDAALLSGKVSGEADNLYRVDYNAPVEDWIDPAKESAADEKNVKNGLESRESIARKRGRNPREIEKQYEREQAIFGATNPHNSSAPPNRNGRESGDGDDPNRNS